MTTRNLTGARDLPITTRLEMPETIPPPLFFFFCDVVYHPHRRLRESAAWILALAFTSRVCFQIWMECTAAPVFLRRHLWRQNIYCKCFSSPRFLKAVHSLASGLCVLIQLLFCLVSLIRANAEWNFSDETFVCLCLSRKYNEISSQEQRQSYKNDFNAEYSEYRGLHARIEGITRQFTVLDAELKQLQQGTDQYKVTARPVHTAPSGQVTAFMFQNGTFVLARWGDGSSAGHPKGLLAPHASLLNLHHMHLF